MKSTPPFAIQTKVEKEWIQNFYREEEKLHRLLPEYKEYNHKQISRMTHIEHFSVNLEKAVTEGITEKKQEYILFFYKNRNPLNNQGNVVRITENF